MNVLIVGLNPSSSNTDPNIPFVGTKSYDVLTSWETKVFNREDKINHTNLVSDVITSDSARILKSDVIRNEPRFLDEVIQAQPNLIIGLGRKVSNIISHPRFFIELMLDLPYRPAVWAWPHPSPSNRLLNNKEEVRTFLHNQRQYVHSLRTALDIRKFTK